MKESKKITLLQQQERLQKEQLLSQQQQSQPQQSRPSYSTTNDSIGTNTTSKSNQLSMTLTSATPKIKRISKSNSLSFTDISTQLPTDQSNDQEDDSNQFAYNQAALDTLSQQISR